MNLSKFAPRSTMNPFSSIGETGLTERKSTSNKRKQDKSEDNCLNDPALQLSILILFIKSAFHGECQVLQEMKSFIITLT